MTACSRANETRHLLLQCACLNAGGNHMQGQGRCHHRCDFGHWGGCRATACGHGRPVGAGCPRYGHAARRPWRDLRGADATISHSIHYGDLSRISEMKRLAAEIAAAEPRIDVLINNAGALFGSRQVTEDNLELTFAVNHMAYFVLTAGLRERLLASSPARIVNTASDAHRGGKLDFDDLQSRNGFSGIKAYGRSKLCNILFTRELSRPLRGGRESLRTAFIPGSSPRALVTAAAAFFRARCAWPRSSRFPRKKGRGDHRLSGFLAGGRERQRRVFLQMSTGDADEGSPRRRGGQAPVGGVRRDSRESRPDNVSIADVVGECSLSSMEHPQWTPAPITQCWYNQWVYDGSGTMRIAMTVLPYY